eukprot:scaffold133002_cov33-Phaeocystis_antarctica.AAC.1
MSRGCAPDPLTPGQVRGVPEGGCRLRGFMSLREITGKRIIVTHLSNHTPGVILTVHDISHLG